MTNRNRTIFLGLILLCIPFSVPAQNIFEEQTVATGFNRTSGTYVCDVDGDGANDIVGAAINSNEVAWWRNGGGDPITWTKQTIAENYGGAIYVFAADIDHDGDIDVLATAANAGEVAWFRNDGGNPIVWSKVLIAQNFSDAHGIQACDLDSDGDMDIIATSAGLNKICWWENTAPNGDGSTWEEQTIAVNFTYTQTVSPGDIDGDGHIDIVAGAGRGNEVAWWRNDGALPPSWTKHTIDNNFLWPHCVVARDIDGDGKIDVAGSAWIGSQIAWWRNLGGNPVIWQKQVIDGAFMGTCEVEIADMDNDGKPDVVGSAWTAGQYAWWHNNGKNPVSWSKNIIGSLTNAWPVAVGDLDNDGYADVVGGSETLNKIVCWVNRSRGPKAPALFSGHCECGNPASIVLRWNDPTEYLRGGRLSNFRIHLYRGSTFIAEVDSGVQTYTDTSITMPELYTYYINAVTPDDSSATDSITVYANKIVTDYSEDFEHGKGMIYRTGTWDTAGALAAGGAGYSFTDSPDGNYPLNSMSFILLPRIVLTGQPILTFNHIAIVEDPCFGWIDVSIDQGNSYTTLRSFSTYSDPRWQDGHADPGDWAAAIIDLTPYTGDTVIIRFRLTTANNLRSDGWYIDDIRIGRADSITTFTHSFASSWNLVSLPLEPADGRLRELFPDAVPHAFAYRSTYVVEDSLRPGAGYWVKYGGAATVEMTGRAIPHDTIPLNERWNLIGIAGTEVNSAIITTQPTGIIETDFYAYNGSSYIPERTLRPGKGYWVKASKPGTIVLSTLTKAAGDLSGVKANPLEAMNRLNIIDAKGREHVLYFCAGKPNDALLTKYELPPMPPAEATDVRFSSERFVECAEENSPAAFSIIAQSMTYPLTIRWTTIKVESGSWSLLANGTHTSLTGNGVTRLTKAGEIALLYGNTSEVAPREFMLQQNSPNPFNPTTTIRYALPADARVKIEIFNILGENVATIVDANQTAGYHSVGWNAAGADGKSYSSGTYFYRIDAIDLNDPAQTFLQVKKMLYLK